MGDENDFSGNGKHWFQNKICILILFLEWMILTFCAEMNQFSLDVQIRDKGKDEKVNTKTLLDYCGALHSTIQYHTPL